MKKNKSTSLLIIPKALGSSKKLTGFQSEPLPPSTRLLPSRSIPILPCLPARKVHTRAYDQQTSDTANLGNSRTCPAAEQPREMLRGKMERLHARIQQLEGVIADSRSLKGKDYEHQLKLYESTCQQIKQCELALAREQERSMQCKATIQMAKEDWLSQQADLEQCLAEREYCDEVLQQYQRQYEHEGALLMEQLRTQAQLREKQELVNTMNQQLHKKQQELASWKQEINFELQQKMRASKLTQLRVELMRAEEQANLHAEQHGLPKIREMVCSLVKARTEGQGPTSCTLDLMQQGMEVYLCRNALCSQLERNVSLSIAVSQAHYDRKVAGQYFSALRKIEACLMNPQALLQKRINEQYLQQICTLRKDLLDAEEQIEAHKSRVIELEQRIEQELSSQNVQAIEELRQWRGKYDLAEIKARLKTLREEQLARIAKIKTIYSAYGHKCDRVVNHVDFMNQIARLQKISAQLQLGAASVRAELAQLATRKQELENKISMAVSRWGDISSKKDELRKLYRELGTLNKRIRQADQGFFHERPEKTSLKLERRACPNQDGNGAGLRQTLKLRASRHSNKQNHFKTTNSYIKFEQNLSSAPDSSKTRKPSMLALRNSKNFAQTASKVPVKNTLTELLLSKMKQ